MADDKTYPSFLSLLNELQLIAHINSLSQLSQDKRKLEHPENHAKPGDDQLVYQPGSFVGTSTPTLRSKNTNFLGDDPEIHTSNMPKNKSRHPFLCLVSSLGSDPFDDNLDSQLLRLNPQNELAGEPALLSASSLGSDNGPVPGNQLALFRAPESSELGEERYLKRPRFAEHDKNDGISRDATKAELDNDIDMFTDPDEENQPEAIGDEDELDNDSPLDAVNGNSSFTLNHACDNDLLDQLNHSIPEEQDPLNYNNPDLERSRDLGAENLDGPNASMFAEVGPEHEFGDYDTYFQNKYRKQQVADRDFIRWEKQRRAANGQLAGIPRIFAGCRIFVNGNTTPTLDTIHKLVILHGGTFLSRLLNKSATTHIICDGLTPRKRVRYRNYRVVRAQWIADCVAQETLLDWKKYRLIEDIEPLQKRLGFLKVAGADGDASLESVGVGRGGGESGGSCGGTQNLDILTIDEPDDDRVNPILEEPEAPETGESRQSLGLETGFPSNENTSKQNYDNISQLAVSKPRQPFAQMDARHPDFLKHFFANSRLHHLSTWKADLKAKFLRLITRGYNGPPRVPLAQRVILHIDFDCFFATASALKRPNLNIKKDAIAVSHGGKSSDIASCNYVARGFGVFNGMWLGRALEKCPELKVVDYDFEAYEKLSHGFYTYLICRNIFDSIFPVLIDDVLVDVSSHCHTESGENTEDEINNGICRNLPQTVNELCVQIRRDIFALTQCPVSIGASLNVLLAKLALRKAKPDGHFYLFEHIQDFLDQTDVRQLPGVGSGLARRLAEELGYTADSNMNNTAHNVPIPIRDVRKLSSLRLVKIFGEKTGLRIFHNCLGRDTTEVHLDAGSIEALLGRKTVSVDVNYGIRFDDFAEAEAFLMRLAKELHARLIDLRACGSSVTLRLAKRAPDAPIITPKFLGLGKCIFVSRSSSLGVATNDWGIIGSEMKALFRSLNVPPQDLRGIAVSMSKLEDSESVRKQRQQKLVFVRPLLAAAKPGSPVGLSQNIPFAETVTGIESVDWAVFNLLPEDIRWELKKELRRRGIPIARNEKIPVNPVHPNTSHHPKVYLQQMFPTQPYGDFKVKRVVESPTKKKKTAESPLKKRQSIKCASPVSVPFNDDTVSYDEDVLNEIPSFIRDEFMQDLERQKKHKRLRFVSMKTEIERKQESERQTRERVVDEKWLHTQPRAVNFPCFNGSVTNYHVIVDQLQNWVRLTVEDEGPHPEDVAMFEHYLLVTLEEGGVVRVMNLLKVMAREVDVQETVFRLCPEFDSQQRRKLSLQKGIDEWRKHIDRLKRGVSRKCAEKNLTVEWFEIK